MSETKTLSLEKTTNKTIEEGIKQSDKKKDEELEERFKFVAKNPNHPIYKILNPELLKEFKEEKESPTDGLFLKK